MKVIKEKGSKKVKLPTKQECLASYEVPIPEETLLLAEEKGLHIQRCDEVVTKRKKNGETKGRILATPKQAAGIRATKLCAYQIYTSKGKALGKGLFKLSVDDVIEMVAKYEPTEEELNSDGQYFSTFAHLKEKQHMKDNRRFLKRIGKDIVYRDDRFWIVEQNGELADGTERGFARVYQVSNFIRKNYKNNKREGE